MAFNEEIYVDEWQWLPLVVNVLLLQWVGSFQEVKLYSTVRGVLSGKVLPAVVNSIPNHTWSHSLPCKEMATPIEVSHRNLAFMAMNGAVPWILKIRVGKKKKRIEQKCLALASRVSLCQHFLSMSLTLKPWRMTFVMRKEFPCPLPPCQCLYLSHLDCKKRFFFL